MRIWHQASVREIGSRGVALGIASAILTGCGNLPSYSLRPAQEGAGPPVQAVVDHIACELTETPSRADATVAPDDFKRLTDYEFVASVDLTLKVSQTGAVNPALSFLNNSNSLTALIGVQYTDTRDQSFEVSYSIDFSRLKEAVDASRDCTPTSAINGTLGLPMTVKAGLALFDRTQKYNVFAKGHAESTTRVEALKSATQDLHAVEAKAEAPPKLVHPKPARRGKPTTKTPTLVFPDIKAIAKGLDIGKIADTIQSLENVDSAGPAYTASLQQFSQAARDTADALSQQKSIAESLRDLANRADRLRLSSEKENEKPASADASNKFQVTIDFILTEGVSGGPTWTFKTFKGPADKNPLINGTRTTTDTLQITFTPTCRHGDKIDKPVSFWEAIPACPEHGSAAENALKANAAVAGHDYNAASQLNRLIQVLPH